MTTRSRDAAARELRELEEKEKALRKSKREASDAEDDDSLMEIMGLIRDVKRRKEAIIKEIAAYDLVQSSLEAGGTISKTQNDEGLLAATKSNIGCASNDGASIPFVSKTQGPAGTRGSSIQRLLSSASVGDAETPSPGRAPPSPSKMRTVTKRFRIARVVTEAVPSGYFSKGKKEIREDVVCVITRTGRTSSSLTWWKDDGTDNDDAAPPRRAQELELVSEWHLDQCVGRIKLRNGPISTSRSRDEDVEYRTFVGRSNTNKTDLESIREFIVFVCDCFHRRGSYRDLRLEDLTAEKDWTRLGHGSFGHVYRVKLRSGSSALVPEAADYDVDEDIFVAVKVIRAEKSKNVEEEIATMKKLSHPNLPRFHGSIAKENVRYILMQLCRTDLAKALQSMHIVDCARRWTKREYASQTRKRHLLREFRRHLEAANRGELVVSVSETEAKAVEKALSGHDDNDDACTADGLTTSKRLHGIITSMPTSGSLHESLKSLYTFETEHRARWCDKFFWRIVHEIACGMAFLHHNQCAHLDLKPANIMLELDRETGDLVAKIGDFGTARFGLHGAGRSLVKGTKCVGTPVYTPHMDFEDVPSSHDVKYAPKMFDVYSFALTVWEMYTRTRPYSEFAQRVSMIMAVTNNQYRPSVSSSAAVRLVKSNSIPRTREWPDKVAMAWVHWPARLKRLLQDCWAHDLRDRPSFETIKKRWAEEITERMLREGHGWWRGPVSSECRIFRFVPTDLVSRKFVDGLRKDALVAVKRKLLGADGNGAASKSASTTTTIVGIKGMGGLGKSTLSQQLAVCDKDVERRFSDGGIFWLTATTTPPSSDTSRAFWRRDVLTQQKRFLECLLSLHHAELSAEQRKRTVDSLTSPDDALEALKQFFTVRWPATEQRPMLIVLDDVSDSEVVGKLVPRDVLPSGSAVLMTYRDDNVGRAVGANAHPLTKLSIGAGLRMFAKLCARDRVPADAATSVAKRLGFHPMAMKIIGLHVARRALEENDDAMDASKPAVWKKMLNELNSCVDDIKGRDQHMSVYESISLSLKRLAAIPSRRGRCRAIETKELEDAFESLGVLPEDETVSLRQLTHLWSLKTDVETRAIADTLVSNGLLERTNEGEQKFRVHDLCRDLGRNRLDKDKSRKHDIQKRLIVWAGEQDVEALLSSDAETIAEWERIFVMCLKMHEGTLWSVEYATLMGTSAEFLREMSMLAEAKRYAEGCLTVLYQLFGYYAKSQIIADALLRCGVTEHRLGGNLERARGYIHSSLSMQYELHSEGSRGETKEIAETLLRYGDVLFDLEDLKGARDKYEASLAMRYSVHPKKERAETRGVADTLHKLGIVFQAQGDRRTARELYEKSLNMCYALHPAGRDAKTQRIATRCESIGSIFYELGDLSSALRKYNASLAMRQSIHRDGVRAQSMGIATTLQKIGDVLSCYGNLQGAREKYEASLEMRYAIYPDGRRTRSAVVARLLLSIGDVLKRSGDVKSALEKYEAWLAMYEHLHPDGKTKELADGLCKLGGVLKLSYSYAKARNVFETALETHYAIRPEGRMAKTEDIASAHYNLGRVLFYLGDLEGAHTHQKLSLEMDYAVYGKNAQTLAIATSLRKFARVLYGLGDRNGALENMQAALDMRCALHPDGSSATTDSITRMKAYLERWTGGADATKVGDGDDDGDEGGATYKWQVLLGGIWTDFQLLHSVQFESAVGKKDLVPFEIEGNLYPSYVLDMRRMVQENVQFGKIRKVRRVCRTQVAVVISGDGDGGGGGDGATKGK